MTSVIIGHQLSLCNVSSSGLVCPILGHWVWFGSTELTFHLWPPMSSSWRVYTLLTHCLKNGRPAGTTSFEYYYVKGWDTLKKEGWCLFCFGPRHWLNKDNERKKKTTCAFCYWCWRWRCVHKLSRLWAGQWRGRQDDGPENCWVLFELQSRREMSMTKKFREHSNVSSRWRNKESL